MGKSITSVYVDSELLEKLKANGTNLSKELSLFCNERLGITDLNQSLKLQEQEKQEKLQKEWEELKKTDFWLSVQIWKKNLPLEQRIAEFKARKESTPAPPKEKP